MKNYKVQALDGTVTETFDISEIVKTANNTANNRNAHNYRVQQNFIEWCDDFINKLRSQLNAIGVEQKFSPSNQNAYSVRRSSIESSYGFGHGRGRLSLHFYSIKPTDSDWYSTEFNIRLSVYKNWLESSTSTHMDINTVADVINKGSDVIKFFLINEQIEDFAEKNRAESELNYL